MAAVTGARPLRPTLPPRRARRRSRFTRRSSPRGAAARDHGAGPQLARRPCLAVVKSHPALADDQVMLLERFPVSVGVVAGVVIAVTSVFVLSMPMYRSPIDGAMLRPAVHGHTTAQVKHTFRDYGVRLHFASHDHGVTTLGVPPPPVTA